MNSKKIFIWITLFSFIQITGCGAASEKTTLDSAHTEVPDPINTPLPTAIPTPTPTPSTTPSPTPIKTPSPTPLKTPTPTPSFNPTLSTLPISNYLIGQNAWMPWFRGGILNEFWDDMKTAGYQMIRIGGNDAMNSNKDFNKLLPLIQGVRDSGAEPIVQIPHDFSTQETVNFVRRINIEMNLKIKHWSIGNEPILNKVGNPQFIGEYIRRIASAVKSVDSNAIIMGPDPAWYNTDLFNALLGGYADITGKDSQGRFYIDVITWHTYNFNDVANIENNIKDMTTRLSNINKNRPSDKKLKWAITEINTHYNMDQVTNSDQYTWSFHAGQLFAELYDIGMRYEGFTICPWSIHENSGKRSGTDLGFFDNDLSPRPSYYHTLLLGQNKKSKNIKNIKNQSNVKIISMGDSSGVSVMILNKDKYSTYSYAVKLDLNTISNQTLKIQIDAGLDKEITGVITAKSTQMLVFCADGRLSKKFTYTAVNAEYKQAPNKTDYSSCSSN